MNETKISEIKSALMAIKFGINKGFIKFEDVEDSIKKMIDELNTLEQPLHTKK
jgi:hypothetical protein